MELLIIILLVHVMSASGATLVGESRFSQESAEELLPSEGKGDVDALTGQPHVEFRERSKNSAVRQHASANSSVIIQSENGPKIISLEEYVAATVKENIIDRIKGLRSKDIRDFAASLFACTLPDQLTPVFYNNREFICCQGLFNRTSKTQICCEKQVVDSEQYFCCSDKIHPKLDTNHTRCCGDRTYDSTMFICCNDQLYERRNNSECCHSKLYDTVTQLCCYGTWVYNRSEGDACCGLGMYHSDNQTCCQGMVQPAYGRRNNRGECCKDFSYDARCYSCDVNGLLIPMFDINKRICCDGQIKKRRWPLTECCGRRTLDASNFTCINGSSVRKFVPTTITTFKTTRSNSTAGNVLNGTASDTVPSSLSSSEVIVIVCGVSVGLVIVCTPGIVLVFIRKKGVSEKNGSPSSSLLLYNENEPMLNPNSRNTNSDSISSSCLSCNDRNPMPIRGNHKNEYSHQNNVYYRSDCPSMCLSTKSKASSRIEVNLPMEDASSQFDCFMVYKDFDRQALAKDLAHICINDCDNLMTDSSTQTFAKKECNLLTTFGRPFAHTYMIDARKPTVQMPESDETMTLSKEALQDGAIETHCTSFWNVEEIMRKFKIPKDETIASPVAEYDITGYSLGLPGYSVVVKPFIGRARDLKVYKFKSDQGVNPIGKLIPVPPKDKQNEEMDMYYEIEGKYVYIYTKSFSGFLCTTCKHSRNLRLTAFLYGSYKQLQTQQMDYTYEVRLKLYIADELLNFKDYQQEMKRKEENEGRRRLTEPQLELLDVLTPDDELELTLTCMGPEGTWASKLRPNKQPIFPDNQTVKLKEVAEQCQDCPNMHCERNMPKYIEWYLVNVGGRKPETTFQCIVDVVCKAVSEESQRSQTVQQKITPPVIVDDLQLPDTPKTHSYQDDRSLSEITVFLNQLEDQKKQKLMIEISERNKIKSTSFEDLFMKMKYSYMFKEDGVVEEIVRGLERCAMHSEIDRLREQRLLPYSLATKPTQTSPSNNCFEGAACKPSETTSLLHNRCAEWRVKEPVSNRSVSENDLTCRRELSQPLCSSFNGNGPPGFLPRGMVRREIEESAPSQVQAGVVGGVEPEVPVQEVASMDETELMKIDEDREANN